MDNWPQRVAFCGDWHGNLDWARKAIRWADRQDADVILHLGDFGGDFTDAYLDGLDEAARSAGLTVCFVDGNHEDHDWLDAQLIVGGMRMIRPCVVHLPRGFRWEWCGVRFLAVGGAHSVDRQWRTPGFDWWPQETLSTMDVARCVDGGDVDVIVSHDCPWGVRIPGLEKTAGWFPVEEIRASEAHRKVLRGVVDKVRPRFLFHGHYHRHYTQVVDFGWGPLEVWGLDCDGTQLDQNVRVIDLTELQPS